MSLGKKLAAYRKLAGFTQQQLGDELNLSPQAISKWENDLAEPDLATLRTLSELYKVPIGEMIDTTIGVSEPVVEEPVEETVKESEKETIKEPEKEIVPEIIGFCKSCGVTVNNDTIGERSPAILCRDCKKKRDDEARKAREREELKRKAEKSAMRSRHSTRFVASMIVAGIIATVILVLMISSMVKSADASLLPTALISTYVIFSYVACLFYDCFVRDMFIDWATKSFQFPGLIFTFDLDGIIWLIGMKLLFWFLGIILGFVCALIGIALGMICAPFVFPFIMISMHRSMKKGTECKYL